MSFWHLFNSTKVWVGVGNNNNNSDPDPLFCGAVARLHQLTTEALRSRRLFVTCLAEDGATLPARLPLL
jgi:hypothetical protein